MYEVIADPHCISHSKKLFEYILREGKGATLISCNGTAVSNDPAVIERNFEFIREGSTSRRLKKHTLHIPISLKKGVGEFIEDEHFEQIAKDYMEEMDRKGIKMKDAQYVLVKHEDTQYNHAHLVVNRVRMEDGATIKDNYIYRRSIEAAERVSKKLVRDLEKQLKATERFEAEPEIEGIGTDRKLSDLEREETELHSIGEDLNKRKRVGLSRLELAKEERAAKVFASDLQRKEDGIAARELEVEEIGKVVKQGGVDFEEARQGLKDLGGRGDSVELERHYSKEDGIAARELEVEEIGKVVKQGGVDFEEARQGLKDLGGRGDSVELERHYSKEDGIAARELEVEEIGKAVKQGGVDFEEARQGLKDLGGRGDSVELERHYSKEDGIAARELEVEEIGKAVKQGGVDFEEARQGLKDLGGRGDSVELERHYKKVKEQRDAAIRKSSRKSIVGKTNTIRGLTKDLKKAEDGIDVLILGLNAILNLIEDMRRLHTARERYKKHQKELGRKRAEYAATKAQTAEAQGKYKAQVETVKAERKKEAAKTERERAAYDSYQNLHTKKGKGWNRYKVKRYDYKVWREEYNYFLNAERGGYAFGRMLAESTGLSSYKMKGEDTLLLYQKGREKPIRLHAKNLDPLNKRVLRTFLDNEKELSKIEFHNFSNIIYGYANQSENIKQFGLFLQQHFADKPEKLNIKWEGDKVVGFSIKGADGREQTLEEYFKVSKVFNLNNQNIRSYFESKERLKDNKYYTYTRWVKERNLVRSIALERLGVGATLEEATKKLKGYRLEVTERGIFSKESGTRFEFKDIGATYFKIGDKTYLSFEKSKRIRDIKPADYKDKPQQYLKDWERANYRGVEYERKHPNSKIEKVLNDSESVAVFIDSIKAELSKQGFEIKTETNIKGNITNLQFINEKENKVENLESWLGKDFAMKSVLRYLSNKPKGKTETYRGYLRELKAMETLIEHCKKQCKTIKGFEGKMKEYNVDVKKEGTNLYFHNKASGRRFAGSEISYKYTLSKLFLNRQTRKRL